MNGIRPPRALGGACPWRGVRPDRRLYPLARPRAHQNGRGSRPRRRPPPGRRAV